MRGDLQEGHFYASRCHLPIFPSTKSGFLCALGLRNLRFRAFRAQNRGFCAFLAFATLVFGHFEHKIEVFVRFLPSEPPFSGILSTKTAFLCQKRRYFPGFGSSRAQNRHFCALLSASFFPMAPPASNKPHLAEKISGLASNLAHLGRMWLPPGQGAAAGWQMVLPDCAARKKLPLRWRDCCSTGTAARKRQSCAGDYGLVPQRRSRCKGSAIWKMRGASIGKPHGTIGKPAELRW